MARVEGIYWGSRSTMIHEVSAFDPLKIDIDGSDCAYLVMPLGDAQYDTEWFSTRKAAMEHAKYLASEMGCSVVAL